MQVSAEKVFEEALKVVEKVRATQLSKIKEAGALIAECILNDGVVHVFGTGHSKAFAMEMANRAGGLVPVHGIYMDELLRKTETSVKDDSKDSNLERDPESARKIIAQIDLRPQDVMIITSNSGRNAATVEMASIVKQKGLKLIVVTSMDHTTKVTSRHESGKRLFEFADIVIDNCAPYGDTLLELPGLPYKACSISSISGAFIAQGLTAEAVRCLLEKGVTPPVLISANVDGGDEHNEKLRERYKGRI